MQEKLSNIELAYILASTTRIIHLCDLGMIYNFKTYYRKSLLTDHIQKIDINIVNF